MSEPSRKSRRLNPVQWKVTLDTPHTFKTLLSIVTPTVSHVTFHMSKDGKFCGLLVDELNVSRVCALKIAYECSVDIQSPNPDREEGDKFCVNTDLFKKLLSDAQASTVVNLVKREGDDFMIVETSSPSDRHSHVRDTIQLIDGSRLGDKEIDKIKFQHMIEVPSDELKMVCSKVSNIQASFVRFKIREPFVQSDESRRQFIFSIHGDGGGASTSKMYCGSTFEGGEDVKEDETRIHIDTSNVNGDMFDDESVETTTSEKFNSLFPLNYIATVLRSIDRVNLQLFFGPSLPMVLQFGLGGELSYVKVIIAPKGDE